jgi:tRNA (adenine57-N1/adenine58-N1)-methyltransferase catalytic subunit
VADLAAGSPSGVRRGPFQAGERITLNDSKGRRHSVVLAEGGLFHTTKGAVRHDELISQPEGVVVTSAGGTPFLALRPLLNEFTVTMPRGAAVVYPKDAARILVEADIFPGARVIEAGAGSGALTCYLLRAIGEHGRLISFERREEFAAVARRNVEGFFAGPHPAWELRTGELVAGLTDEPVDRVVLDLLAPWDCVEPLATVLEPGGVLATYVTTTTQLGRLVETLRAHGGFTEPEATESLVRVWHAEGLAVRPRHDMVGHTGFVITARRLAPGQTAPPRRRRPAPGAYGEEYSGPRAEPR